MLLSLMGKCEFVAPSTRMDLGTRYMSFGDVIKFRAKLCERQQNALYYAPCTWFSQTVIITSFLEI